MYQSRDTAAKSPNLRTCLLWFLYGEPQFIFV
jgi:hypothetical protein